MLVVRSMTITTHNSLCSTRAYHLRIDLAHDATVGKHCMENKQKPLCTLGMAIFSMDPGTHGYPTRLGKGMEHISAHGSVDMDTHEQPGWARL